MGDLLKDSFDEFSPDRRYRYVMGHIWGSGRKLTSVALNPSVGSAEKNDATNERLERRAHAMGLDGVIFVNIFPFVAADPRDMKSAQDPFGDRNRADSVIIEYCRGNFVLCGWGTHGSHMNRGAQVRDMLQGFELHTLGLTKCGQPKHPLYIAYGVQPAVWSDDNEGAADG